MYNGLGQSSKDLVLQFSSEALLKRCGLSFMILACRCDPMHSKYVELFAASPELFLWVPRGADKAWCHATEAAKAAGCTGVIILDDNLRSFSVASEHGTTLLSNSNVKLMLNSCQQQWPPMDSTCGAAALPVGQRGARAGLWWLCWSAFRPTVA